VHDDPVEVRHVVEGVRIPGVVFRAHRHSGGGIGVTCARSGLRERVIGAVHVRVAVEQQHRAAEGGR
jgi:hypothetical protein